MRVLYFGTYSTGEGYPRNSVLIEGLRAHGVEVVECHEELWRGSSDKVGGASTGQALLKLAPRLLKTYASLAAQFAKTPHYDLIVVGYTGQIDIFLARALNSFRRKPIVLDAFISLYDTVVNDRRLASPSSLKARLLWWLDKASCTIADLVLLDTNAHISYFVNEFGIPEKKFARLFVGGDEVTKGADILRNRPRKNLDEERPFTVLYFGTYIPLHGIEYIVEAAALLRERSDIRFIFIGEGQLLPSIRGLAARRRCTNIEFIDHWLSPANLGARIADADLCLGIFGATGKAARVIPCKVFDCMAFGKTILTADTPAARELLKNDETALLVEPGNPHAIAETIKTMTEEPDRLEAIGRRARGLYLERCTPAAIGAELLQVLSSVADTKELERL